MWLTICLFWFWVLVGLWLFGLWVYCSSYWIWGLIAGVIMGLLVRVFDGVGCLGWVVASFASGSGCARWWICLVWLLSCLGLLRLLVVCSLILW